MVTRRDIIGGIAGIIAARQMPAMPIGARSIAIGAKIGGTPTARDYVQNGLVTMWDGIENDGWDTHNPDATTWKDLIKAKSLALLSSAVVYGDGVYVGDTVLMIGGAKTGHYFYSDFVNHVVPDLTIEFVISGDSDTLGAVLRPIEVNAFMESFNLQLISYWSTKYYIDISGVAVRVGSVPGIFNGGQRHHFSFASTGEIIRVYVDGVKVAEKESVTATTDFRWAARMSGVGLVSNNVRVYNRALTADEVAANYAIDKARFNLT